MRQTQFPISAQINHYTSHDRNQLNTIIHQINNIRIKRDGGEKKRTKDFRLGSLDLSCPRVNRSGKKAKQNRENRETGVGITFVLFLLWLLLWMLQWKPSILLLQPYFPQSSIRRRRRRRRWCLGFSSVGDLERKRPFLPPVMILSRPILPCGTRDNSWHAWITKKIWVLTKRDSVFRYFYPNI